MSLAHEIRQLVKLSWPLLIAQVTQTLMGVSDTIMAGRVSATDMAAVAIAASVVMPILFFLQGIILALPPIVSRLDGSKKWTEIPEKGQQTLWLALMFSVPLALCYPLVPGLAGLLPMDPELERITLDYIQYLLLGAPAFAVYQVFRQYCEGLSVTRPSMVIMGIGLLVNIPANYVFIYGKLGLPAFGGAGCGIATSLVFTAMMICTWLYTHFAPAMRRYHMFQRWYAPRFDEIGQILRLGVPIAMTILFEVSLFAVVALLLSPYGPIVVAAHQVALNFSSLMFMVPLSLGLAVAIRVGYLLGEDKPLNARKAVHGAWMVGIGCALITASLSFLLRYQIAGLYTVDQKVVSLAADLMFLAAIFQFSDAIQVISGCALRGYKDTKAMFYISFVSYWGIGLTTGCILGLTDWIVPKMAASGFWIGFIVGLTAAAIFLGWRLTYIQRVQEEQVAV
ncbi:MATE family efflux transporter [Bowmanella dokdonensis]|uniref:Multidrug-efflux transporter n=1 Tax=Bowmanella dokdonensis TaxID=751969 RepID=A0A939DS02_9ALTE|nr:MATE family efflux transporter [Bowmanella dokdonensis]MBN7827277.1 MATE family efflux transporter [Bowmanella dokdonensis]